MTDIPYLRAAQMREADRRCIEVIGIPGVVLMNNAGSAVYQQISSGPVGIVCGKGNNGGDGYVVARLALLDGLDTRVVVLAERDAIVGDARVFLQVFENLGGIPTFAPTVAEAEAALSGLSDCAVLVDAVLGTGISGKVRGIARAVIDAWPSIPTVAIDLPSGLNADTGEPCGACIHARTTVAIQYPKIGFQSREAAEYLGEVIVADIGIPALCADDEQWNCLQ